MDSFEAMETRLNLIGSKMGEKWQNDPMLSRPLPHFCSKEKQAQVSFWLTQGLKCINTNLGYLMELS